MLNNDHLLVPNDHAENNNAPHLDPLNDDNRPQVPEGPAAIHLADRHQALLMMREPTNFEVFCHKLYYIFCITNVF